MDRAQAIAQTSRVQVAPDATQILCSFLRRSCGRFNGSTTASFALPCNARPWTKGN